MKTVFLLISTTWPLSRYVLQLLLNFVSGPLASSIISIVVMIIAVIIIDVADDDDNDDDGWAAYLFAGICDRFGSIWSVVHTLYLLD